MKRAMGTRARIPGGNAEGVMDASELLGKTATARRMRLRGETVVVGSGDAAVEAALAALGFGSEKATVVSPELRGQARASAEMRGRAEDAGVRIIYGWGPSRVDVHTDGRVCGVFFKHCERAFDERGDFAPVYDESNIMAQYCDNAVFA